MLHDKSHRLVGMIPGAIRFLSAVVGGTALGFIASICRPLAEPVSKLLRPYLLTLPPHAPVQALLVLFLFVSMALLAGLSQKLIRSLKLGLIRFPHSIWILSTAVFWVAYDLGHTLFGLGRL